MLAEFDRYASSGLPQLEAYERLVFLDADMMAVNPADSLFRAPPRDVIVTDGPWSRFNAGLMARLTSPTRHGRVALTAPRRQAAPSTKKAPRARRHR